MAYLFEESSLLHSPSHAEAKLGIFFWAFMESPMLTSEGRKLKILILYLWLYCIQLTTCVLLMALYQVCDPKLWYTSLFKKKKKIIANSFHKMNKKTEEFVFELFMLSFWSLIIEWNNELLKIEHITFVSSVQCLDNRWIKHPWRNKLMDSGREQY